MSLIQSVMKNTPDRHLVEPNERYEVKVIKATFGSTKGQEETDESEGKAQRPVINVTLAIADDPLAKPLFEQLYFPIEGDSDFAVQAMGERIKVAFVALNYNSTQHGDIKESQWKPGMETIELPGFKTLRGFIVAGIEEFYKGRNGEMFELDQPRNFIKRWVMPEPDKKK